MRPDIDVPRSLHGAIRDHADEFGEDWRQVYVEALERGLERLRDEATAGLSVADAEAALGERGLDADEIAAVVAMWEVVRAEGEASPSRLQEVHAEEPAGKSSTEWWWKTLRDDLVACPGVERESQRRFVWRGEGD
jgi:hypothetical protein